MSSKAATAVARIVFLASDVVVDSRPASLEPSLFAQAFEQLSRTTKQTPTVLSLPHGADPGSTLARRASSSQGLVSYTTTATTPVLARIVPHLPSLASQSVVLHLAVDDDLAPALLLRSSAPFFIYSDSIQQAHDHALLASRLARSESKLVVHAFLAHGNGDDVEEVSEDKIQPFLRAEKASAPKTNGHVNGHGDPQQQPEKGTHSDLLHAFDAAAATTSALVNRGQSAYTHSGFEEAENAIIALGVSIFLMIIFDSRLTLLS
jgi:sulfite reductase (NADPH) hemoprotein beta-component